MSAPGCALSNVRARGRRPAEPVRPDGAIVGYDLARTLDLHHRDLVGPADLHRLRHRLLPRPDCGVVPAIVANPPRPCGVRRLLHADGGDAPPFAGAARRRIALDLDGLPLPVGADHRDLACCAHASLVSLPAALHRATAVVQATASHGLRPGARLRLWFWCDRPVTGAECKRWLRGAPVDRSVFGAAQPIYPAPSAAAPADPCGEAAR